MTNRKGAAMLRFVQQRAFASLISLLGLVVLVFFLSRLTGDPAALFLPLDATEEMRQQFREVHGLNQPLLVQFGRYLGDLAQLDFGESLRKARPAIDVVLEAFAWTFQLAVITMLLVTFAAVIVGSLAAFRVGGIFDRIASFLSLIGASARISGSRSWGSCCFRSSWPGCPHPAPARPGTGSCRFRCCSSAPSG